MIKYRICDHNEEYIAVEVFNECDIEEVKEKLHKEGYLIIGTRFMFGSIFIEGLKREILEA